MIWNLNLGRYEIFVLPYNIQPGYGPPSIMFNRDWNTVKGVKWPGCDSDQALLSATKVQIELKYISGFHMYGGVSSSSKW
jgi:hypothetical protein